MSHQRIEERNWSPAMNSICYEYHKVGE